jgi:hypothetical protein
MKSNNNNNDDDDDDDDNNNNTAMGSVHAWGDTFLTFGLKALTETNTSRLAAALHKTSTDNGIRLGNFSNCKSRQLLLHLIQKHTGASPDGKTHNKNDHILIENDSHLYLTSHLLKGLTDNGHYLVVAK